MLCQIEADEVVEMSNFRTKSQLNRLNEMTCDSTIDFDSNRVLNRVDKGKASRSINSPDFTS